MKINEVVNPHNITDLEREKYLKNPNVQDPKILVQLLSKVVNNPKMNDAKFRDYMRNILPNFQDEYDVEEIDIKAPGDRAQF